MADGAVAQALVLEAPRRLAGRELPLPNLGDDDARVRVAACGLCGTDHQQFTGERAGGFAFVPGHETVGTIDAIGPERHSVGGWPPATWPICTGFSPSTASPACAAGCAPTRLTRPAPGS
ncbi:MAG: alcohol dehydrogenase [Mycobacterium sp.]|nr:alcohol dehydrogenase [Mycobacterium sp.]MDT7763883.1 alcohol dehydrogenase [Mycobacterium sp.]